MTSLCLSVTRRDENARVSHARAWERRRAPERGLALNALTANCVALPSRSFGDRNTSAPHDPQTMMSLLFFGLSHSQTSHERSVRQS